ncbi:Peptidase S8 subtilisin-related protein [Dioscorea alata]|uniref:Peptidase S8 subtilisin-related protein n=1 Tax=Dioscorea alata TaxID=55571 RepID=A0ACB7TYR9_DIOAL|nr:Peptidase S8 subtilisin-related protein [Dioscorea alata]
MSHSLFFSFLLLFLFNCHGHANPNSNPKSVYAPELTRTPNFLGLYVDDNNGVWNITNRGKGVIIGMIDTGVMPDHPSFEDDQEMPPPPARWKGACEFLQPKGCNKKLIGARSFITDPTRETPSDQYGHGTYTSSVVAGRLVKDLQGDGQGSASGSAIGIAPLAHIAMYKVCNMDGCDDGDILNGINAAIKDGVDIISISIGSSEDSLYNDPISIGAFRAAQKGILVSKSAGNFGPSLRTITAPPPWVLTVAASNIDRRIGATVKLGNGEEFKGESLTQKEKELSMVPLVYPGSTGDLDANLCADDKFGGVNVSGKIVMCEDGGLFRFDYSYHVKNAGGVGVIIMNNATNAYSTHPQGMLLPTSNIDHESGLKIKAYIQSTKNPVASINFDGTITDGVRAPKIASFSSRGPCKATPGIMKPDITGPGVGVLGAFPYERLQGPNNSQPAAFKIESGTSSACPHLSGVAALLKSMHPNWTGSMIKSAIMTTADITDNTGSPIVDEKDLSAGHFAMGAGHVNAVKATDPGLVYNIKPNEYLSYLCGLGYNTSMVNKITGGDGNRDECSTSGSIAEHNLNYPSIIVPFTSHTNKVTIKRRVTNVGDPHSTYWLDIELPNGVEVEVNPSRLSFTRLGEVKTFKMIFKAHGNSNELNMAQGQLKWVSTKHVVRSPISIMFDLPSPLS